MNYELEFFNTHVSHLTQLGIINILTLKCIKKNMCKKKKIHHYLTWILVPLNIFAPKHNLLVIIFQC